MLEELQQTKLALRRALKDHPLLVARLSLYQVDTNPTECIGYRDMLGEEVLVSRALVEHRLKLVVTDPAARLRRPYPDLLEGAGDRLCHGPVKRPAWPLGKPGALAAEKSCQDARLLLALIANADVKAGVPL